MLYPELMRDKYNREIIKDVKRSLVKWGKAGKLAIDGKYCFLAPDLYAFCEWLFLGEENPQGLLADGEVACSLYRDGDELDCLRSPHLYKEHAIRKNIQNDLINKWFDTKCIYTSCHDLISKYLMFDCDGDKSLVVRDKQLIRLAKRNMQDIVPLYYNMHKAEPSELNANTLFHGLELAYTGGNIGIISNNISKVWNSGHITQKEINVVKWLCLENNCVIDYAKTLYKPIRPKDVDVVIETMAGYMSQMANPHTEVLQSVLDDIKAEGKYTNQKDQEGHGTGSDDFGDVSCLMPLVHFNTGGVEGSIHGPDLMVSDPYLAYVVTAKIFALTAYRLMKDNAAAAKENIADYKPIMTKESYIKFQDSMQKTETFTTEKLPIVGLE